MPQPPWNADAWAIEPGTTTFGSRLIDRDPTTGAIRFADPYVTLLLSQLVGARNITGLFIVGRAGDGSPYNSIQDALDAVPTSSTAAFPSVILLNSGVYTESFVIDKDGVFLVSAGGTKIVNSGATDTVTVAASVAATPLLTVLRGLEIENTNPGSACVKVDGADTFATGTATVISAPLVVGDTLTIGGIALTGVASTRTSGANDFSVSGGTPTAIGAELAAAINDTANALATLVEATVAGPIVTITAVTAGAGGNAITLVPLTVPPGGITVSGGTLTGGGAAGSLVASDALRIENCLLNASGVGSLQVDADTSGNIQVLGGTWRGSSSTSLCSVANCTSFRVFGVEWTNDFGLSYDTGLDEPVVAGGSYEVKGCGKAGDFTATFTGSGGLTIQQCPDVGDVAQGGNTTLTVGHSGIGTLTLSDTVAATLSKSSRGTGVVGAGTPTLAESSLAAPVPFAASASEVVTFDIPQPDAGYQVLLDSFTTAETLAVTAKSAASFTISASAPITGTAGYMAVRNL